MRRPSATASSTTSDGTATGNPPSQSTTATSGMIIPIKSTMEEEYIEVPYGREQRESSGTLDTPNDDGTREILAEDSASEYPISPRSPPGGLSGLNARLRVDDEDDEGLNGNKSGEDFYDKYGRSSVNSDRSAGGGRGYGGRASVVEETEKIRSDYEYKIATMQNQLTTLQRDLSDSRDKEARLRESEARVDQLQEEMEAFRHVCPYLLHGSQLLMYRLRKRKNNLTLSSTFKESSTICVKLDREKRIVRPEEFRTMRKSSKFCGIVANDWNPNVATT